MSTVSKAIADKEIERCKKRVSPRMYCIASYVNTSDGSQAYKLCYRPENYVEMMTSPFVSRVILLWQSERMKSHYIKDVSEAHRTIEKLSRAETNILGFLRKGTPMSAKEVVLKARAMDRTLSDEDVVAVVYTLSSRGAVEILPDWKVLLL